MTVDEPAKFDDSDKGRVVGIAPAAPGWWAVYNPHTGDEFRCPVAAWVVTEMTIRMTRSGKLSRYPAVTGVDPTGGGWDGSPIEQDVEYVYEPDYVPPQEDK